MTEKKIKIKLVKSLIGQKEDQKKTVAALGLKKLNYLKEVTDTPQIRGMLFKVKHLVSVEEI